MNRLEVEGVMSYQEGEQAPARPLSRLQMVHEALNSRPDVFIAGGGPVVKRDLGQEWYTEWNHYIVAPKEAMFDLEQLEVFRQTLLLPGVRAGMNDAVRNIGYGENDSRNQIQVGWMAYDDFLGTIRRGITIEEEEPGIAARLGLYPAESQFAEQRLNRRTIIRVYPHPLLATVVHDVISKPSFFNKRLDTLQYRISPKQMSKFRELISPQDVPVSKAADVLTKAA